MLCAARTPHRSSAAASVRAPQRPAPAVGVAAAASNARDMAATGRTSAPSSEATGALAPPTAREKDCVVVLPCLTLAACLLYARGERVHALVAALTHVLVGFAAVAQRRRRRQTGLAQSAARVPVLAAALPRERRGENGRSVGGRCRLRCGGAGASIVAALCFALRAPKRLYPRENQDQGAQMAMCLPALVAAAQAVCGPVAASTNRMLASLAWQVACIVTFSAARQAGNARHRRGGSEEARPRELGDGTHARRAAGQQRRQQHSCDAGDGIGAAAELPSFWCDACGVVIALAIPCIVLRRALAVAVSEYVAARLILLHLLLGDAFRESFTVGEAAVVAFAAVSVMSRTCGEMARALACTILSVLASPADSAGRRGALHRLAATMAAAPDAVANADARAGAATTTATYIVRYAANTVRAMGGACTPMLGCAEVPHSRRASPSPCVTALPYAHVLRFAVLFAIEAFLVCMPLAVRFRRRQRRRQRGNSEQPRQRQSVDASAAAAALPPLVRSPLARTLLPSLASLATLNYGALALVLHAERVMTRGGPAAHDSAEPPAGSPVDARRVGGVCASRTLLPVCAALRILQRCALQRAVLVAFWAVVLLGTVMIRPPHTFGWRLHTARKWYHLVALVLFVPALWVGGARTGGLAFLAVAQAGAFAVLVVAELSRAMSLLLSTAAARTHGEMDARGGHAAQRAGAIGTDGARDIGGSGAGGSSVADAHSATMKDGVGAANELDDVDDNDDCDFYSVANVAENGVHGDHGGCGSGGDGVAAHRPSRLGKRRAPPTHALHRFMTALLDERERGRVIVSHLYLLAGCAFPLWLYASVQHAPCTITATAAGSVSAMTLDEAVCGLVILGVFDSFATVGGSRFGRWRWPGSRKTLEGSLLGFLSALLAHSALHTAFVASTASSAHTAQSAAACSFAGADVPGAAALRVRHIGAALVASTLFEALTTQIDNLVLPTFYLACLQLAKGFTEWL